MNIFSLRVITTMVVLALLCGGCATDRVPKDALRLHESALDVRSIQTRTFLAPTDSTILAATVATLQDLEFNIDRIEVDLGVVTASKVADADSATEQITMWTLALLCGCADVTRAKDEQHIMVTMVVLPSLTRSDEFVARITIQRVIYDKAERVAVLEQIDEAEIYQKIFDKLAAAMFLEVNGDD